MFERAFLAAEKEWTCQVHFLESVHSYTWCQFFRDLEPSGQDSESRQESRAHTRWFHGENSLSKLGGLKAPWGSAERTNRRRLPLLAGGPEDQREWWWVLWELPSRNRRPQELGPQREQLSRSRQNLRGLAARDTPQCQEGGGEGMPWLRPASQSPPGLPVGHITLKQRAHDPGTCTLQESTSKTQSKAGEVRDWISKYLEIT